MGWAAKVPSAHYRGAVRQAVRQVSEEQHIDAEVIAEAVTRLPMRFTHPRTVEQVDLQARHRILDPLIASRTALINQMRAICVEYGITSHRVQVSSDGICLLPWPIKTTTSRQRCDGSWPISLPNLLASISGSAYQRDRVDRRPRRMRPVPSDYP